MINSDFPILNREINGKKLIYLDNAATTQKPQCMIDSITEYYENHNANIHRGIHTLTEESSSMYENTRIQVAKMLNNIFLENISNENLIFTKNATESLNLCANLLSKKLSKGDSIAISVSEHHSNLLPWIEIAKSLNLNIVWIELNDQLQPDIEDFKAKIQTDKSIKILSLTGASNVTGAISEIDKFGQICKENNIIFSLDAAQFIPHAIFEEKKYFTPDFISFSAHKLLGPTGVGVLFIKDIGSYTAPFIVGGGTIQAVTKEEIIYKTGFELFEAGTPDIASVIAFSSSLKYIEELDKKATYDNLSLLNDEFYTSLSKVRGLKLYSPTKQLNRIPVFSFSHEWIHPHDIADFLNNEGIAVRSGQHCTGVLHNTLSINATTRASAYIYNTVDDVTRLINALDLCINYYNK